MSVTRRGFIAYRKANPHQRVGQAFVNYFDPNGKWRNEEENRLFYEPNDKKAAWKAVELMDRWQIPEE